MCWITDKKPTRKTATEDIICYKVFYSNEIKYKIKRFLGIPLYKEGIKELYSLYRNYKYYPYTHNPTVNIYCGRDNNHTGWVINVGYHSYSTLNKAKFTRCPGIELIVECIIPKNTIYYINEYEDIVSSNIIITDKIID